jgi:hypothetical protein
MVRIRILNLLGSLQMAVPLLLAIAAVLAWGTLYETRFGTASVQRFIYRAWWFQVLLGFLALNLATAAWRRYPWQRRHAPFVLAHIGIILILLGGILGGRFGIEGQLIIPEGAAEKTLQLPVNVLVVRQPNPGVAQAFPTRFETQAWVREPNAVFPVSLEDRRIRLTVDRYFPDAVTDETITGGGADDNPAVRLLIRQPASGGAGGAQEEAFWLLARDPERFGMGWGEAHLLFLEPKTPAQFERLVHPPGNAGAHPRGVVSLAFEKRARAVEIPVPAELGRAIPVAGTPYRLTFRDYFPDFVITEQGLASRSAQPNNPAVAFTLEGPEGSDAYLLFALHPDISAMHGWRHTIKAQASFQHPAAESLPPNAVVLLVEPSKGLASPPAGLAAALTGSSGERQVVERLAPGDWQSHPWLGYEFQVAAFHPRASIVQQLSNRSDGVKAEAIHVVAQEGEERAEAWVRLREQVQLAVGREPVLVEYRPATRQLPVTIKLMDFRKTTYPGIDMAAEFESDVQLTDPQRGLILMRTISMNNPLRYRGYSFFQSSFIEGAPETTILSVRNDPGTPFVYAGFLIVIGGVVAMFILRRKAAVSTRRSRR